MQVNIESLRIALAEFDAEHKRPMVGDLLPLLKFIQLEDDNWASYWSGEGILKKYAAEPCVYVFFDESGSLIYVGQTKVFGRRLGEHFANKNLMKEKIKSIAFIPIPKNCWFEILAAEGYLIDALQKKTKDDLTKV